jgi:hypothetical protein
MYQVSMAIYCPSVETRFIASVGVGQGNTLATQDLPAFLSRHASGMFPQSHKSRPSVRSRPLIDQSQPVIDLHLFD